MSRRDEVDGADENEVRRSRPSRERRIVPTLLGVAFVGVVVVLGYALWWRRNPSACPYGLRFFVELPHPFITRARLREVLAPGPGERVLEVGPGAGYYALHVAEWLEPGGALDVLDVQQEMLNHVMRRAQERGIKNIVPTQGDARILPYPEGTFDAAYLTVVLGEIPDQEQALQELRRVLKPDGRLVVGEVFPDFHMIPFGALALLPCTSRASSSASTARKRSPSGWEFWSHESNSALPAGGGLEAIPGCASSRCTSTPTALSS